VRVPQMAGATGCEVGRDGLLTFEGDPAVDQPVQTASNRFGPGMRK